MNGKMSGNKNIYFSMNQTAKENAVILLYNHKTSRRKPTFPISPEKRKRIKLSRWFLPPTPLLILIRKIVQ